MFVSAILSVLGLGFMVYVLFALAVYALPFFVAVTVGMYVYDSQAGLAAAFVSAFLAGGATPRGGPARFRNHQVRDRQARHRRALRGSRRHRRLPRHQKASPRSAARAEMWTLVFAWIGAIVVGVAAWARIASSRRTGRGRTSGTQHAFSGGRAANDR